MIATLAPLDTRLTTRLDDLVRELRVDVATARSNQAVGRALHRIAERMYVLAEAFEAQGELLSGVDDAELASHLQQTVERAL